MEQHLTAQAVDGSEFSVRERDQPEICRELNVCRLNRAPQLFLVVDGLYTARLRPVYPTHCQLL